MIKTKEVHARIEPELRQKIEQLIQQGRFRSISEAIREALLQLLKT